MADAVTQTGQIVQKRYKTEPESSKSGRSILEQSTHSGHGFGNLKNSDPASICRKQQVQLSCTLLPMFFLHALLVNVIMLLFFVLHECPLREYQCSLRVQNET